MIAKALAKEPDDRYQTCQDLVTDARDALGIAQPAPERRRRWPSLLGVAALALLAVLIAVLVGGGTGRRPTRSFTSTRRSNEVVGSVAVGDRASSVAVGDGYVWVTSIAGRSLWRVDPQTRRHASDAGPGDPARRRRQRTGWPSWRTALTRSASTGSTRRPGRSSRASRCRAPRARPRRSRTARGDLDGRVRVRRRQRRPRERGRHPGWRHDPRPRSDVFPESRTSSSVTTPIVPRVHGRRRGRRRYLDDPRDGPLPAPVDPAGRGAVDVIDLPSCPGRSPRGRDRSGSRALVDDVVARFDPQTEAVTMNVPVGRGTARRRRRRRRRLGRRARSTERSRASIRRRANRGDDRGRRQPEDVGVGAGGVWVTTPRRETCARSRCLLALLMLARGAAAARRGADPHRRPLGLRGRSPRRSTTCAGRRGAAPARAGRTLRGAGPVERGGDVKVGGHPVELVFGCPGEPASRRHGRDPAARRAGARGHPGRRRTTSAQRDRARRVREAPSGDDVPHRHGGTPRVSSLGAERLPLHRATPSRDAPQASARTPSPTLGWRNARRRRPTPDLWEWGGVGRLHRRVLLARRDR